MRQICETVPASVTDLGVSLGTAARIPLSESIVSQDSEFGC
jgi:hypothetical protein